MVEYFTELTASRSWSGVKFDLYGLEFFTEHVLMNRINLAWGPVL